MITVLLTIALVAVIMAAMAVGVIFSDRELKGSCGGNSEEDCFCERNNLPRACEQINQALPDECGDHDHAHLQQQQAQVKLSPQGITITE